MKRAISDIVKDYFTPKVSRLFIKSRDVEPIYLKTKIKPPKSIWIKPLLIGQNLLVVLAFRQKGAKDPPHMHPNHESMAYLISGKIKLKIGNKEYIAHEDCAWYHPAGVEHSAVALEDCVQIEVKSFFPSGTSNKNVDCNSKIGTM